MSTIVDDILKHHGTKGMKWGRRKSKTSSGGSTSDPRDRKFDKTFSSKRKQVQLKIEIHNAIGPVVQSKVNVLNNKPRYVQAANDGRLKDFKDPITKRYVKEYSDIYMNEMNSYLKGFSSPSGNKTVRAEINQRDFLGFSFRVENASQIKHIEDSITIRVDYIKDDNGIITGLKVSDNDLTQSSIDNVLSHYGKKGMHWGVRNSSRPSGPQGVTVKDKKKRLKTKGGQGHPAHPDAVRARTSAQIAKKSGIKALSNKELQDYNTRLNLEMNAKRLRGQDDTAAKQFIKKMVGRKAPGAADAGMQAALNHPAVKKKIATGLAALAL